jgi:hypothetical protein
MIEFKHLEKALKDYADAIREGYKENLSKNGRRATGNLITSINSKVVVDGNEFEIELQLADYWYYVENGRGAGGFPPINKILEWIRVKPILPHPDKNGKLPTENQLAFLIGRKIANEGFEGSNDLENTLKEVDYNAIIEEALDKDVLGCLDEILQFKL